nr:hypothetical protein [Tanacetum cinerariifolium]
VNLLIAKIEALKDNSTPSSEFLTKSSSTFPKSVLEETDTFDDSLPEFENFSFDLEEISSGSTTTHSDISLPDYEAFSLYECPPTDRSDFTHEEFADELVHIISPPEYDCFYFGNLPDPGEWISSLNSRICENLSSTTLPEFENFCFDLEEINSGSTTIHSDISLLDYEAFSFNNDHIEEISSGSTTTHSDISLSEYDSFVFDSSNDQFPPTDRSDFANEEFVDELAHIISPPEYDCFYFRDLPDPGELISIFNFGIRENLSTTCVNLPIEDDLSPLLAYVVWIFLAYLTYPVIPPYLHPFRNEDTIFDPGITINHFYSFKPGLSHRCEAFKKFNTHRSHLNEWPMIINGKNIPILDVLLFHFYPP